jgi:hypothetical protein
MYLLEKNLLKPLILNLWPNYWFYFRHNFDELFKSIAMKKKNVVAHVAFGLLIMTVAAFGVYTFKEYEKPVRTSSKPSKKKYVKEQPLQTAPMADADAQTAHCYMFV